MSDVTAPGWRLATIGDLILPAGTVDPASLSSPTFEYIDIGSINNEAGVVEKSRATSRSAAPSRARMAVRTGDILFSTVRPYLRAIAQVPSLAHPIASTGFCVLRPAEGVDARYLFHWVRSDSFIESLLPLQRGSSYPAVRGADVLGLSILLPPSLEQARIAISLDELLGGLQDSVLELVAAKRKLALYRQSLLKSAVDGSLTAAWRSSCSKVRTPVSVTGSVRRRSRPLASPTPPGRPLPEGWRWTTVDELTVEQRYGTSAKTNADGEGIPVLRMGNISEGRLVFSGLKFLPRSHEQFPTLYARDGEILFNRTNSPELVGKCAVFRNQAQPYSFASYLIGVTVIDECVPEFIAAFINSAYGREWVASVVSQQVGQANVNGSKLASLTVPVPPSNEQREIVRLLSEQLAGIDEQSRAIDHALAMATAQRQNILRAAFSGRLVPQDPNDEPASVLLGRIRAERSISGMSPPRKRRTRQPTAA